MFLDLSAGILLAIFANFYFGIKLTWYLIIITMVFAISPDIDFIWNFLKRRIINQSHREILHHPLFFVFFGAVILFFFSKDFAFLFILAVFWHFLNDTMFMGLGVQWFWPFSKKYFNLFGILWYQTPGKPKLPFKFFYIWTPEQIKEIEKKYGDPDWIRNIYFKPNFFAVIEYLIFIASIILLILYVK